MCKIKKIYYSDWGQEIYSGRGTNAEGNFVILLESLKFRVIKKIHNHTNVNVLKTILNLIKQEKTKCINVDMNIMK